MMVSNRNLLFQGSIFRGYVSFREGIPKFHLTNWHIRWPRRPALKLTSAVAPQVAQSWKLQLWKLLFWCVWVPWRISSSIWPPVMWQNRLNIWDEKHAAGGMWGVRCGTYMNIWHVYVLWHMKLVDHIGKVSTAVLVLLDYFRVISHLFKCR